MLLLGIAPSPTDLEVVRRSFLTEINRERMERDLSPLRRSEALCRAAQARAEEIASQENLDGAVASGDQILAAAGRAGYRADAVAEIVARTDGDAALVVSSWREQADEIWNDVMSAQNHDVGIGAARLDEIPVYVIYVGTSVEDAFAARTAGLRNLARVREELLAAVNRRRAERTLPRLRLNRALESAAQRHAEDMRARGYYGHASPEGTMVTERARREGYRAERVGENLARGQTSVEQVMAGWMGSTEHRENILNPFFSEVGFGVTSGEMPDGPQVLWVQVLGRSRGR
ncbi:MAG TPA: CAP domain-containing protein [Thermoanaerobaculia bacterium]